MESDSFARMSKLILQELTDINDTLAIIGLVFVSKTCVTKGISLLQFLRAHILSRLTVTDLIEVYGGQWAVITGASDGIGKAYAEELAARGLHLVLISNDTHPLQVAAIDINEKFGVQVDFISMKIDGDVSKYARIRETLNGKDVGILLNNVGTSYDYPQSFTNLSETVVASLRASKLCCSGSSGVTTQQQAALAKNSPVNDKTGPYLRRAHCHLYSLCTDGKIFWLQKLWQLINVNVGATTILTHMILPQMVARGRGAIINVASGGCTKPTPQLTVYAATKAYVDLFSRSLAYEYKDSGVTIQSLTPYYVATRQHRFSKAFSRPSKIIPSAEVYARDAIRTLGYSKRTTGYWPHTIIEWIADLLPENVWMWGATYLNRALRRQAEERLSSSGWSPITEPVSR